MALLSEIIDGMLVVRSVGDHDLETGFRQLIEALATAKLEFERTGEKVDMFFDMSESEEKKDPDELQAIAKFFEPHLTYLTGRMAVLVNNKLHFGMTRLFGAHGQDFGLEVNVASDKEPLLAWLQAN